MPSKLTVNSKTISLIFKNSESKYKAFQKIVQACTSQSGVFDGAKQHYPAFEHLILLLYLKWINPRITRCDIFGSKLHRQNKILLGEAIDVLIDSNLIPEEASLGPRLSFLSLCYHDDYGFRDDPVLLQKMWYVRAHVVLMDLADGPETGEPWKWYDHRLTLVIYSWVRHNRKYHGCPKLSCNCRKLIDEYGHSIMAFKSLYMALENQVVSELGYVRHIDCAYKPTDAPTSLSRAKDAQLYLEPKKASWPKCLVDKVVTPNPPNSPNILYNNVIPTIKLKPKASTASSSAPKPSEMTTPSQPTTSSTHTNTNQQESSPGVQTDSFQLWHSSYRLYQS